MGKEGLDAAMRIRDRLAGKAEGRRGLYLCHGFCELGATPLPARAKQCQAERGKQPTVIAVDFYRTGALFRVARTLNGVAEASPD